jgi:hypothetical protein
LLLNPPGAVTLAHNKWAFKSPCLLGCGTRIAAATAAATTTFAFGIPLRDARTTIGAAQHAQEDVTAPGSATIHIRSVQRYNTVTNIAAASTRRNRPAASTALPRRGAAAAAAAAASPVVVAAPAITTPVVITVVASVVIAAAAAAPVIIAPVPARIAVVVSRAIIVAATATTATTAIAAAATASIATAASDTKRTPQRALSHIHTRTHKLRWRVCRC